MIKLNINKIKNFFSHSFSEIWLVFDLHTSQFAPAMSEVLSSQMWLAAILVVSARLEFEVLVPVTF